MNTDLLVQEAREIIASDLKVRVHMTVDESATCKDVICEALTKSFIKRNSRARFVLHSLSDEQERADVEHYKDNVKTGRRKNYF